MQKITNYFRHSFEELLKVKWPTRKQLIELTIIVIVFTAVMGLFTGLFDALFASGYKLLLYLGGK